MIELAEERFQWDHATRTFYRVEDSLTLIDMPPARINVTRQRLGDGWELIASHPTEENAQLFVTDLWARH